MALDGKTILLCVDIGTSSIKGGVIDENGTLRSWNRVGYNESQGERFDGWSTDIWITAFCRLLQDIEYIELVDGVAISGNGPTVVPAAKNGSPLFEALLWLDGRSNKYPDEPSFFLPKVRWFADNHVELYRKTDYFFPCPEYLNYLLTGEAVTIIPSHRFEEYIWTKRAISRYKLEHDKFPPPIMQSEKIGAVRPIDGRLENLLPENLPVYAAGSDFLMSLVGTGAVFPGRTCDRAGTSEGINYCSHYPVNHPRLRSLPHAVDGYFNIAGILSSTGRVFEWFRKISGQTEKSYIEMFREILSLSHSQSSPLFFPSLHVGEVWDFSGAVFTGLEPFHESPSLGKAVVEAIGFAVKDLINTLSENGCRVDELRVSGGQARNTFWNQMKADITGRPVAVPEIIDGELLGNCCAGLTGKGLFSSIQEAAERLVRIKHVYHPQVSEGEYYEEAFESYMELCARVMKAL